MPKINGCWVCLDCDEVFDRGSGRTCPACGSGAFWPLGRWIHSDVRGRYGRMGDLGIGSGAMDLRSWSVRLGIRASH